MRVKMWRAALIAPAVLIAQAATLHGQESRLAQRFDAGTARTVQALVDSARGLALPAEPVIQKALEGASKGADPQTIVSAVRGFVADLAAARVALGEDVAPDALVLGATALDAGISAGQLQQLRSHRRRKSFSGALAGVIYMVSRDVPAYDSLKLIDAMLSADLSAAEFMSLQRLVEQDVRAGATAAEAATVRARALIQHGARLGPGGSLP